MKETKQTSNSSNPADPALFNLKHGIMEWARIILIAVVIAFFLDRFIIANSRAPSSSMENTVMAGNRIIGSRLAYQFGEDPQRGDITIFDYKTEPGRNKTRLVERITRPPGGTVGIKDNHVYVNQSGIPLEGTYLPEEMQSNTYHFEVPGRCCPMLGDNRNHSSDVRFWEDPYIPEEDILARVLFRYYPGTGKVQ